MGSSTSDQVFNELRSVFLLVLLIESDAMVIYGGAPGESLPLWLQLLSEASAGCGAHRGHRSQASTVGFPHERLFHTGVSWDTHYPCST